MLASYLTITETFFRREPNVFAAFTDFILSELMRLKNDVDRTIRIWSAACSMGEELYSIAIALQRMIPDIKGWNIKIQATDINTKALKKADSGIYTKWSYRNCPLWLQTGYFQKLYNDRFEIIPKIKEMVTFKNLNLIDDVFPSFSNDTHSMDIIFCRNVLMYFSDEWVSRISRNLFKSLNKNRWFVLASCELFSWVFPQFKRVNFQDAILYRKGDKPLDQFGNSKFVSVPDKSVETELRLSSTTVEVESNPFIVKKSVSTSELNNLKDNEVVFESIPEPIVVVDVISKICNRANKGHLQDVLSLYNEGKTKDKLDIGLYSLRASFLQELEMHNDAITSLKQAIYLDPNFIMGHFALRNLYIRQNKSRNTIMHFKNVLDLISNLENDNINPESDGLSVKYINDIVKDNLKNQK